MNATHGQELQAEDVVRLLRAVRANDEAAVPGRHAARTPRCLPVARLLLMARSQVRLVPPEQEHFNGCAFCQKVTRTFLGESPAADPDGGTVVCGGEGTVVFSAEDTRVEPPKT